MKRNGNSVWLSGHLKAERKHIREKALGIVLWVQTGQYFLENGENNTFFPQWCQTKVLCLFHTAPEFITSIAHSNILGFKRTGFQTACQGKVGWRAPQESCRALICWKAADTRRGRRENPRALVYLLNPSCQQPSGRSTHCRWRNRASLQLFNLWLKQIFMKPAPLANVRETMRFLQHLRRPTGQTITRMKLFLGAEGAAYPER